MKKKIYIVWESYETAENCGCWYDDMKLRVFTDKGKAQKYFNKNEEREGVYSDLVERTITI